MLEFCLATIGVCVFRCVASVTHFFIIEVFLWRWYIEPINIHTDNHFVEYHILCSVP